MSERDATGRPLKRRRLHAAVLYCAAFAVLAAPPAEAQSIYDNFEADETGRAWRDYYADFPNCRSVIKREWATDDLVTATNEARMKARSQAEKDELDEQRSMLVNLRSRLDEEVKLCVRREEAVAAAERAKDVRPDVLLGQVATVGRQPGGDSLTNAGAGAISAQPARQLMTAGQIIERAKAAQARARAEAQWRSFGAIVDLLYRGPSEAFKHFQGQQN